MPQLIVDADGRLWLFVRHLTDVTPPRKPGGRVPQPRSIWNPYALCYTDEAWSEPVQFPESNGRNDMRVSTCLDAGGNVWVSWADDGRKPTRAEEPIRHRAHAARIRTTATDADPPAIRPDGQTARPAEALPSQPRPADRDPVDPT